MISKKRPILIAESAILKIGHILKSKKSITLPTLTRSNKLPKAPPRIKIKEKNTILLFWAIFDKNRIKNRITNKPTVMSYMKNPWNNRDRFH